MSDMAMDRLLKAQGSRWPLICGIVAAPLFCGVVAIQAYAREGFHLAIHPLSLLSLGDLGWIQTATFIATGLLIIACAFGMRRLLSHRWGGTWAPLLVALYGLGLFAAGVFPADPGLGFPPGAVQADATSWHATLHGAAFFLAHLSVILACFVFARRFLAHGDKGWAAYSVATGIGTPALIVAGFSNPAVIGASFFLTGVVAMGWLALVAARMLAQRTAGNSSQG